MKKNHPSSLKVTEIEIVYRNPVPYQDRIAVTQSKTAYEILRQAWDENKIELVEQFKILLLDRRNNCLGVSHIATGGISACVVDAKIVFATALKAKASSIILAHNHPSSNEQPSEADKEITRQFSQNGKLLNIDVLDHLIMTSHGYFSFADQGMIPPPP